MNTKQRKAEHPFVDKVFNYDLEKFQKGYSNIVVVGTHGRLYCQSSAKLPTTKHIPMLPLIYNPCLLQKILIQQAPLMFVFNTSDLNTN